MGASASCIEDKESAHNLIAACIAKHRGEYTKLEDCCSSSDRSSRSSKLRNSFEVEQKMLARISEFKQSDESFHMERKILKQNKNVPIGRSSSPTTGPDQHYAHQLEDLSIEDNEEEQLMYPQWKSYLEHMEVIPADSPIIPEAISAGSTPNWFPMATPLEPLSSQSSSSHRTTEPKRSSSCPDRRPTQVFYHLTVLNELDNDLEVMPEQRPTPYQLYMQHQMGEKKSRIIVWMPAQTNHHPSEQRSESTTGQTPPPVFRALKPKPTDNPEVKTYRRINS